LPSVSSAEAELEKCRVYWAGTGAGRSDAVSSVILDRGKAVPTCALLWQINYSAQWSGRDKKRKIKGKKEREKRKEKKEKKKRKKERKKGRGRQEKINI
jgi:hypothetical protein